MLRGVSKNEACKALFFDNPGSLFERAQNCNVDAILRSDCVSNQQRQVFLISTIDTCFFVLVYSNGIKQNGETSQVSRKSQSLLSGTNAGIGSQHKEIGRYSS